MDAVRESHEPTLPSHRGLLRWKTHRRLVGVPWSSCKDENDGSRSEVGWNRIRVLLLRTGAAMGVTIRDIESSFGGNV